MDVEKAMGIFNISSFKDLKYDYVKKKYRLLMKKNHPDIGGDENYSKSINKANEVLNELMNKIKEKEMYERGRSKGSIYIVSLEDLESMYKGNLVEVEGDSGQIRIGKDDIGLNKVMVSIQVDISYNGNKYTFKELCYKNLKDEYTIECRIPMDNDTDSILIEAHGKEVKTKVNDFKYNIILSYDKLIKLEVYVERIERNEDG